MNVYFVHVVPVVKHNYCWVEECALYYYLWIHIILIQYLIHNLAVNRTIA